MKYILTTALAIGLAVLVNAQEVKSIKTLFQEVNPSVVTILSQEKVSLGGGDRYNTTTVDGLGSGVLISSEGLILTAAHVVQTAELLKVKFADGTIREASVVASSPTADVALIKMDWEPVGQQVATIGDSDSMEVGDQIFVVGSPHGLEHSLSVGYISARHSEGRMDGLKKLEYFQTDAAINTGNSGGPMFNMKGEVIGLVSFILSKSGGFEGIGFAATSNVAKRTLIDEQIAWSGMDAIMVEGEIAKALNVPQKGGILIQSVSSKGWASQVGLRGGAIKSTIEGTEVMLGGDVILGIDDLVLNTEADVEKVLNYIREHSGSEVTSHYLRNGRKMSEKFKVP